MREVVDQQQLLQCLKWTILEHLPYRPDLALSDLHLFSSLNDHLSGHKLASGDDMKTAVTGWLKLKGMKFYEAQIKKPVP